MKCGHRETKCFCCGRLGHLARMCKSKGSVLQKQPLNLVIIRNTLVEQTSQPTGTDEYDISCYMPPASHPSKPQPIQISLLIEGQPVDIELDTRASISPHVKKSISARSPHTTFCNQVAHIFRRALTCNRGDNRRCDLWAATSPLTPGGGCR